MTGTVAQPEGITYPPIDQLLESVDSKYALVLYAAKRARQINAYYAQFHDGLPEFVGPLVDADSQEKPLSVALREIDEGLLTAREVDAAELAAAADFEESVSDGPAPLELGDDAPEAPPADFSY